MICPHCQSPELRRLNQTTDLGYAEFRCGGCRRKSNERTGTPFNFLELPTDIVFEIVLCRLRYKLSPRNPNEMFLLRGSSSPMKRYAIGKGASCVNSSDRPAYLAQSARGTGRGFP